jgi:hypothetical protein
MCAIQIVALRIKFYRTMINYINKSKKLLGFLTGYQISNLF